MGKQAIQSATFFSLLGRNSIIFVEIVKGKGYTIRAKE